MNAELIVQVTVGGRPLWFKKKSIPGELTQTLTEDDYGNIIDAAQDELEECVKVANAPDIEANKKKKR